MNYHHKNYLIDLITIENNKVEILGRMFFLLMLMVYNPIIALNPETRKDTHMNLFTKIPLFHLTMSLLCILRMRNRRFYFRIDRLRKGKLIW